MSTLIELAPALLFGVGTGLQFIAPKTFSIPGFIVAVLAILLAAAIRLWCRRRRSGIDPAICSDQGDDGGRDSTENGHLDGAK
jgi:hypothetical protein